MSLRNLRIKSSWVNCPLRGRWPFMENVHCSSFSSNSFNELDLYVLSEICFWWFSRQLTCSAPLSVSLSRLLQCIDGQLAFCGQSHQLANLKQLYSPFKSIWTLVWIVLNLKCPFGWWEHHQYAFWCAQKDRCHSPMFCLRFFLRLLTVYLWPRVHFCLLRWIFTLPGEPSTWRPPHPPSPFSNNEPLAPLSVCVHSESNMLPGVCLPVSDGFTFCVQSERCLRFVGCSLARASVHCPSTVLCVLRLPTALVTIYGPAYCFVCVILVFS